MGRVDFESFISGLAATAAVALQEVEKLLGAAQAPKADDQNTDAEKSSDSSDERKKHIEAGLNTAAQLIDTLAMLEDKTKGNVTDAEKQLLQTALTDLRFRYLSLLNRSRTGGTV